jgi:hypothetical protein
LLLPLSQSFNGHITANSHRRTSSINIDIAIANRGLNWYRGRPAHAIQYYIPVLNISQLQE